MDNLHPDFHRFLSRKEKEDALDQKGVVIWMTGLSGSGKSTIAQTLERKLFEKKYLVQVLDGDNIRTGLNNNLSFSLADRYENIRRIAEVAKLFCNSGIITICSFVSPTLAIRSLARKIIGSEDFVEVFINTPLAECERRDIKGLYKKARQGEITGFTGIDSPFEIPENADLEIDTMNNSINESTEIILDYILKHRR